MKNMGVQPFVRSIADLHSNIEIAIRNDVNLFQSEQPKLHDFKGAQKESMRNSVLKGIATVDMKSHSLFSLVEADRSNKAMVEGILSIVGRLGQTKNIDILLTLTDDLLSKAAELPKDTESIEVPKVPAEISQEIQADVEEMSKCMKVKAFRSAIILCGRVLETALHRKYFEITGNDLLEKAPGTGLGNLVAKIADKGTVIDPGLGNQIHLINQVRVHSVHKKQTVFNPSQQQAQAIILYTMDVLDKLW